MNDASSKHPHLGRLASPTMAQIFMHQGHLREARETIDAVLEGDPDAGAALVIRDRLRALDGPAIQARSDGRVLEVRWQEAPADAHVLVIVFRGRGVWVTSRACDGGAGQRRIDLPGPTRPGAASVCLALCGDDGAPRPIAVTEALVW
ncbi:MAG: hypothetical protein R3B09_05330 [Nannocystaceae bacterium]